MSIEETIEQLTVKVERLENALRQLVPKTEQYVGPSVVVKKTGWNPNQMRTARNNGSIKYKQNRTGGYVYLLSSIPEHLLK